MAAALTSILPGALGLLGLYQQGQQQHSQDNQLSQAQQQQAIADQIAQQGLDFAKTQYCDLSKLFFPQMQSLQTLVNGYNPVNDTNLMAQAASNQVGQTYTNALKNLDAQYRSSGGSPSGDTEFGSAANQLGTSLMAPLQNDIMQMHAGDMGRKIAAMRDSVGPAPGNIANAFMDAANTLGGGARLSGSLAGMYQPNFGPSLASLSQSLQGLLGSFGSAAPAGYGASGTGLGGLVNQGLGMAGGMAGLGGIPGVP